MRSLLILSLCVVACSPDRRSGGTPAESAAATRIARGPDPLVLRVPTNGGAPRVVAYPNVDSTVWTTDTAMPGVAQILEFDNNDGSISYIDSRDRPGRLDLNTGEIAVASRERLTSLASVSGAAIFGISAKGVVQRLTPTGDWTFTPPSPARAVFPQRDGSMLVMGGTPRQSMLWRVRPPNPEIIDSLRLPDVGRAMGTSVGDRIYFTVKRDLLAIETRKLAAATPIARIGPVNALAVTPSGDRVFVSSDSLHNVRVIDRYRGRVAATLPLPRAPSDLRVDPLGRYLLVRDAARDSVWVVAIGNDRVIATFASRWRGDLPFVAPDGAIATLQGNDVVFLDPQSRALRQRVADGGRDFWFAFWWTGFHPRATGANDSLVLAPPDTTDSTLIMGAVDSGAVATARTDTIVPMPTGFSVQVAWGTNEQTARDSAAVIHIEGKTTRVEITMLSGIPIYHVLIGPYATRDEAERAARATGRPGACVTDGVSCK